ncbi:MAG TPA: hypothetical protein VF147_05575 [Vicinamibacterales bacterium]
MKGVTVLVAFLALAGATVAQAAPPQEPSRSVEQNARLTELVLRDGSRLYGTVVSQTDDDVVFRTQSGTTLTVMRSEVFSMRAVDGVITGGEFLPSDPHVTRMFFGPTARALKRGQAYTGLYAMFMPMFQVGITDRISIGAGTPLLLFALGDGKDFPFWITPKVQVFNGAKTQVAVGAFHGMAGHESAGIGYVVATHGTVASSFTVGVGGAYASENAGSPVLMFGAERQTRRNLKVITENYVWRGGYGVVTGGVRFFGEKMSTDVAAVIPVGEGGLFVGALINFVYIF